MNRDEVAKVISQEFHVPCIAMLGSESYIFNAPPDIHSEELHQLRRRISERIGELEDMAESEASA